jgi:uncharacterized protein YndB with AHSA1/START domain
MNELSISLFFPVPRAKLWEAYTLHTAKWFAPAPLTTEVLEMDLRPGGAMRVVMHMPDGQKFPVGGVYLEVVPGSRLVSTDAYEAGWKPSTKPFFTSIVTFEDEGEGTRYTARALHWREEDMQTHAAMGFEPGWTQVAHQLAAVAATL